ncbi:LysR family transcriptional regulator [Desmospora sp. 8437]|nr:LysR family transcriptional regulator [Desmospora sp. 8437]
MELRHLKTFRTVAEKGGFSRAGEELGYAQSTVTAHIHKLEEELGSPLFDRLGKRTVLTDAGKHLLPYAKEMVRLSREAAEIIGHSEAPAGPLRIGAAESLLVYRLPSILHEFRKRYPQVRLELYPGQCRNMRTRLKEGEMDLAFLLDEERREPELHTETLIREKLMLVAPPGHALAGRKRILPGDLMGQTLLQTELGCSYRTLLERRLKKAGRSVGQRIDFWNIEAIKQCTISGLGIAYLPRMTVDRELEEGRLIELPWLHQGDRVFTQLAWHKDKWTTPAMAGFIELVRERIRPGGTGMAGEQ